MGFVKGVQAALWANSCAACRVGNCGGCEYLREMEAMNHCTFPDETAGNMIYLRPWCACYVDDEDRHCGGDWDEGRSEMQQDEPSAATDAATMNLWEAHYRPYPDLVRRLGFDEVLFQVEACTEALSGWGDVQLSGHFGQVITLSVEEIDAARNGMTLVDYQDVVARLLARAGLEGYVVAQRTVSVSAEPAVGGEDDG